MSTSLFLLFRGTYSAKTAALYSKPTSIIPLTVCNDSAGNPEQFLYGIFKATSEMIHTVVEAMRYLATDFLGASQPNSVKIITTGHSLGGAMCTIFTYLWMGIKKTVPYNAAPYNILSDNIVCLSLGAPRCLSSSVAKKFCDFVSQKKILFLRITTNGDPVAALPPKTGFQHPCSEDATMRETISEACAPQLTMRPTPNINYAGDLDCLNYKGRVYVPNLLSHTVYLDILYTKAVDIVNFLKGIGMEREVLRGPNGSTTCRLIMGQTSDYKAIFFDVNQSREMATGDIDAQIENQNIKPGSLPVTVGGGFFDFLNSIFGSAQPVTVQAQPVTAQTPTATVVQAQPATIVQAQPATIVQAQPLVQAQPIVQAQPLVQAQGVKAQSVNSRFPSFKIGGPVAEDRRMTSQAFNSLVQKMVPIQGDLCPLKGEMFNPFNNQIMPDLSCPGSKFGGRRRTRKFINKKSINKTSRNKTSRNKKYRTKNRRHR
jgi:hypothetical protein